MEQKLKIAMLGQRDSLSECGGVEVVTHELSRRMAALGHSVTLFNRYRSFLDEHELTEHEGVRFRYVPGLPLRGAEAAVSSLRASLRAAFGSFDVVHIHSEGPAAFCLLPKLMGKKVVVTIHGLDHRRAKWGKFASFYLRLGEKNAARYADQIIVLSQNIQQYFTETYGRDTVFLPNGLPEMKEAPVEGFDGLEKDGYFLFLGRLVPEKGLMTLLDAFRQVQTDRKLVIAGANCDTDDFALQLRKKADPRVIFTGEVHGEKKTALLTGARAYILPSEVEGMPLSLLEALGNGLCCVTSDIPECAEVVKGYGLTFPVGDTASLTAILDRLDRDDEAVSFWRKKAHAFPREYYEWDYITEKTLELYQKGSK